MEHRRQDIGRTRLNALTTNITINMIITWRYYNVIKHYIKDVRSITLIVQTCTKELGYLILHDILRSHIPKYEWAIQYCFQKIFYFISISRCFYFEVDQFYTPCPSCSSCTRFPFTGCIAQHWKLGFQIKRLQ